MIPSWILERLQVFDDPRFRFLPEPHEYYLGERKLTNFSSWLEMYKEPFIREERAAATAGNRGCSAQQVLDEWDRSQWVGTKTHEFIEAYFAATSATNLPVPEPDADVQLRCQKFLGLRAGRLKDFKPVGQEISLFHELTGLCGTLDFLGWHEPTQELYVLDWKTNGKIGTDRDKVWRMLLGVFSDLIDHEHNKYSLQISMYRLFLEAAGIPTAGGIIVHLPPGNMPAELYKARDYCGRLRDLLF